MTVTRVDCYFFRGAQASLDTSSYVALNPRMHPGSIVLAGAAAARENISGQVACRLSLQHFIEGVQDYFRDHPLPEIDPNNPLPAKPKEAGAGTEEQELSLDILETAFKRANDSVYSFGHKLAAGGRLAASLLGIVVEDNLIAVGRVGQGSAYLFRDGSLFPFFITPEKRDSDRNRESFVGSNSLVSVELASVQLHPCDMLLMFSSDFDARFEKDLAGVLSNSELDQSDLSARVVSRVCAKPEELAFAAVLRFGPENIFLSEIVNA